MASVYLPVLLLIGFVALNGVLIIGLSSLVIRARPTPVKSTAYESGIPPLADARDRFSIKFYMVAILFILFDLETVFLVAWAAHFRPLSCSVELVNRVCPPGQTSFYGFGAMLIFLVVLTVGFIYEWKKGAMQWD